MIPSSILEALARGAQILTGTQRAARALERAYGGQQRAEGRTGWPAPGVTDWNCWIDRLARQVDLGRAVLTPLQEQHLWRRVQREEAEQVVAPARLAELACSAYGLLSKYRAHGLRRAGWAAAHEDAERFLDWAQQFDRLCDELGVLPRSGLEAALAERTAALRTPPTLLLVGLERRTPSQDALVNALGCEIIEVEGETKAETRLVEALDEGEELRACARWARERVDAGAQVGLLVPDLQRRRAQLDRALRRALEPESSRRAAASQAPAFEFSLGIPLGSVPLAAAALDLLRWLGGQPLPAARVSALLTGEFLAGDPREGLALAMADAALRRKGLLANEASLHSLLRTGSASLPRSFVERLEAALARLRRSERQTHLYWAELIPDLLATAGWPGCRELSSTAFQARERWECLLEEAAAVGLVAGPLSFRAFVGSLREAASAQLFAAESREAPVQVLGLNEAAGLRFDAVWVLGMHEGCWPPAGRLHPLLAPAVQADAGMPHTDPEAERAFAEQQLRRVLQSAPEVVWSYARQIEGGVEGRVAPLLAALGLPISPADTPEIDLPRETRREPDSSHGPVWPTERSPGGSEVLKRQAACGFQGFAARRLGAEPLDGFARGLDAAERGALLHRALERLWSAEAALGRLHGLRDLRDAQAAGETEALVRDAVEHAAASLMRAAAGDPWQTRYLQLEQRRVRTRLLRWLEEEAARAPFAVEALEQKLQAQVGPLMLRLRMDRVDALEAGGRLLLDYKTGAQASPKQWQGPRMEEPQLPIYSEFGGLEGIEEVAFAQIRPRQTRLLTLAGEELRQARGGWRSALLLLADAFAAGAAEVDPRDGADTCRLCGLQGLCRVRTVDLAAETEEVAGDV